MPYDIKKVGNQYCVFKAGDTDPLKCYDKPTQAGAYLAALQHATEAERQNVLAEIEAVLEVRGVDFAGLDELRQAREARAKKYGIGVKQGGNLTPPKGYPEDEKLYGDPTNLSYPCDGNRALAARQYFNHEGQREAGGYTESEWAIVGKRIARLSGEGYVYSSGKVVPKAEAGSDNYARGEGQGVGGERQGDGGPDGCECPECGRAFAHERGTPCAEMQCPDCNVALIPASDEFAATHKALAQRLARDLEQLLGSRNVPAAVLKEARELRAVLRKSWAMLADEANGDDHALDSTRAFIHTVPFALADDAKRIAYGVVFSPDEVDTQDHSVSEEDVEAACHRFMERLQMADDPVLDEHHDRFVTNQEARVCECWIQREPVVWEFGEKRQEVKPGSWCLGVKFNDDDLWRQVMDGEIAGLSPRGRALIKRG